MTVSPTPMSADERDARLRLHLTPGLGSARFHRLLQTFGSASVALRERPAALAPLLGAAVSVVLQDDAAVRRRRERALRVLSRLQGRVVVFGEPDFPEAFTRFGEPPSALWVRGSLPPAPGIAIVGTRRATAHGRDRAARLAAAAADEGRAVISGGAYGIDEAAHTAALDAGGPTVVVFAGGLDRPYPERHVGLFERAARQGAVLSASPPGTPPVRGGFLARNRLVAALASALVVVEAGWRSGAHNTARHARAMGVPVYAVPGSPGTERLLSDGALPVPAGALPGCPPTPGGEEPEGPPLEKDERQALRALCELDGGTADAVARHLGWAPATAIAVLQGLRVEGRIGLDAGGWFRPLSGGGASPR